MRELMADCATSLDVEAKATGALATGGVALGAVAEVHDTVAEPALLQQLQWGAHVFGECGLAFTDEHRIHAEATVRRIEAAARGALLDQYLDGATGRASEIEAGAERAAVDLVADVRGWSARLDDTFRALTDDCWGRRVRSVAGGEHPVAQLPFRRWREAEVHLVDLDIEFGPADWSQQLVDRALPRLIEGLSTRGDKRALMAWTLGRGSPPTLEPWG